jgi:hypothetical protein
MNQVLEIALRIYVSPSRDNWDTHLPGFALSYNGTPHSASGFSPSELLFGYLPDAGIRIHQNRLNEVDRSSVDTDLTSSGPRHSFVDPSLDSLSDAAGLIREEFEALRRRAKDALAFSQAAYLRNYNRGRLNNEFNVGDHVLINTHSLRLLGQEGTGVGRKLLQKFQGPFEVTDKLSPVTYRLRLPSSYRIHPIINISHLELYHPSPSDLGERTSRPIPRVETAETEWEIDSIVAERTRKRGKTRIRQYRVRYTGFGPESDEWVPRGFLKNAPEILEDWDRKIRGEQRSKDPKRMY